MVQINIETIKIITDNILNKLKIKNEINLTFEDDWYWIVPEDSLINLSVQPDLEVGSLKDDIDFLNSLVDEDYDTNFLELERLSALFRFLSVQLTS